MADVERDQHEKPDEAGQPQLRCGKSHPNPVPVELFVVYVVFRRRASAVCLHPQQRRVPFMFRQEFGIGRRVRHDEKAQDTKENRHGTLN